MVALDCLYVAAVAMAVVIGLRALEIVAAVSRAP